MKNKATTVSLDLHTAPRGLTSKGGHPVLYWAELPAEVKGCYIQNGHLHMITFASKKKAALDMSGYLAWKAEQQMKAAD